MDRIHVCYAMYDKKGTFSKYVGTSMTSVFENTKTPVTVHLMHDSTLTADNRKKFEALAAKYGQDVRFYNMEELVGDVLRGILDIIPEALTDRFSQAALYRLLAGAVMPKDVRRLIYLDADTIVHLDIETLWREPVGGNGLAAVDETTATQGNPADQPLISKGIVTRDRYFNSGVLVIDIDRWREHPEFLTDGLQMLSDNPDCFCFDQDILNYSFAADYAKLPGHYDVFVSMDRYLGNKIRPAIYHYAGAVLDPFNIEDAHNSLYVSYFAKSPWCSEDFVMRLFGRMYEIMDSSRAGSREYLTAAAGRRRIFLGSAEMRDKVERYFRIKKGEEYKAVIGKDGTLSVKPLIQMMKENRGALFVLFMDVYDSLEMHFQQAGFEEKTDYVDGFQLMTEAEGGRKLWGGDLFGSL